MLKNPSNWKWSRRGKRLNTWLRIFTSAGLAILAIQSFRGGRISAQSFPGTIGRIEGDDLEVATMTPAGVEKNEAPTVVATGSDVTLRSGRALLLLDGGGEISICGPAHFKMLKAGGALTMALDYGRVHPSMESPDTFTIYTPTIIATPIAISGGRRDVTLGLEQGGGMCVLTTSGAMRVVPQFSDQSVIVPQGGTVTLSGGQIASMHTDASECACEFLRSSAQRVEGSTPRASREISALSHPVQPERKAPENTIKPPETSSEPVYTVIMPALTFDANSPTPPPAPDPETILLVREVRMRSSVVFRGHVNPARTPAATETESTPEAVTPRPTASETQPTVPPSGMMDRVRSFFRKLTGRNK